MNVIRKFAVGALAAVATGVAIPPAAIADPVDSAQASNAFAPSSEWNRLHIEMYRNYVPRMSTEDRAKLSAMEDKLMQMEMDQKSAALKMDMEIAKAQRDIVMFVLSKSGGEGH